MSTPAQFTAKMRKATLEIQGAGKAGVTNVAKTLTHRARQNIAVASGGDSRLSGVGKTGARVGAKYSVRGGDSPTGLVTAIGPLQLIERDTQEHGELPRSVGRIQGRRTKEARYAAKQRLYNALFGSGGFSGATPLSTPYGPRYRVQHPGTRGKHPFERAVDATVPDAPRIFQRELEAALRRAFR